MVAIRKPARKIADGFRRLSAENGENRPPDVLKLFGSIAVGLFQRRIDARELRVERRTKTIDGSDNGEADAGGDQTVFDRGRARLIGQKLRNNLLHSISCTQVTRYPGSPHSAVD
jgi:hypothetical protein